MGIIIPAGDYNGTIAWTCEGLVDPMTVSLGLRDFTEDMTLEQVATAFAAAVTANDSLADPDNMQATYTCVGVTVTTMVDGDPLSATVGINVTGDLAGGANPPQCASLITKNTARGGRKGRGRWYLPIGIVLSESGVSPAGTISSIELGDLQDCLDSFYAALIAEDLIPLLFHSDGTAGNVITSFTAGNTIATQRRRLR